MLKDLNEFAREHPIVPQMETEEDKIIRLLKSAGGSLYQSEITKTKQQ
jgi:uncharacterized membrane protein